MRMQDFRIIKTYNDEFIVLKEEVVQIEKQYGKNILVQLLSGDMINGHISSIGHIPLVPTWKDHILSADENSFVDNLGERMYLTKKQRGEIEYKVPQKYKKVMTKLYEIKRKNGTHQLGEATGVAIKH